MKDPFFLLVTESPRAFSRHFPYHQYRRSFLQPPRGKYNDFLTLLFRFSDAAIFRRHAARKTKPRAQSPKGPGAGCKFLYFTFRECSIFGVASSNQIFILRSIRDAREGGTSPSEDGFPKTSRQSLQNPSGKAKRQKITHAPAQDPGTPAEKHRADPPRRTLAASRCARLPAACRRPAPAARAPHSASA